MKAEGEGAFGFSSFHLLFRLFVIVVVNLTIHFYIRVIEFCCMYKEEEKNRRW